MNNIKISWTLNINTLNESRFILIAILIYNEIYGGYSVQTWVFARALESTGRPAAPLRHLARLPARGGGAHACADPPTPDSTTTLRALHYSLVRCEGTHWLYTYSNKQRTRCYQRTLASCDTHQNKWSSDRTRIINVTSPVSAGVPQCGGLFSVVFQ